MNLLAKPVEDGLPGLPLAQHLLETYEAARYLFGPEVRWARNFCAFFGLEAEVFRRSLYLACLFHDIGKACTEFQAAMDAAAARGPRHDQSIRHEHLSGLIIHEARMWDWLSGLEGVNAHAVAAGVLGHHLKCGDARPYIPRHTGQARRRAWALRQSGTAMRVRVLADDARLEPAWTAIAEVAGAAPPAPCTEDLTWVRDEVAAPLAPPWNAAHEDGLERHEEVTDPDSPYDPVIPAVRAGVICADSAASALFRKGVTLEDWCGEAVRPRLEAAWVRTHIVEAKLSRLGPDAGLNDLQARVAQAGRRALVMAPCAAGKTLAAHAWAARWLSEEARGRYIFLYPTTGTTTEGYRDYVAETPDGLGRMLHSRAAYDLRDLRDTEEETHEEVRDTLGALSLWTNHSVFTATADQFLGFLANARKGVTLLPALADSVLVLDEVHSYDGRMWSALLEFLRRFDLPVLCMTATLPETRKRALLAKGFDPVETAPGVYARPRYSVRRAASLSEGVARGVEAYEEGRRVLIVVNQVGRAQSVARQLEAEGHENVRCYHARYRRMDVGAHHAAVVDAFRPGRPPVIAVTTQVCEMSLDLDAEVLITEEAPPTSLVQRFGRTNRHSLYERGEVVVCPPGHESDCGAAVYAPYAKADLDGLEAFLETVSGPDVSQQALEEALAVATAAQDAESHGAPFVEAGYFPLRGPFRDILRKTECVLAEDFEAASEAYRAGNVDWQGYVLAVPHHKDHEDWPDPERGSLPRGIRVMPADYKYVYDPRFGAERTDR